MVVVLGSTPSIEGILLCLGDRLFNHSKVVVQQFLGSRKAIEPMQFAAAISPLQP
jgi:hypothetical protein